MSFGLLDSFFLITMKRTGFCRTSSSKEPFIVKKDKIFIFLDIDGVLNTSDQWKRMYQLDEKCVSRFAEYAKALHGDVRIILSSSWKNGFDPAGNHTPQIRQLLDQLSPYGLSILGKTDNIDEADRGREIGEYIASHNLKKANCIVIDDDASLFKTSLPKNCKLLLIDADKGFPDTATDKKFKGFFDFFSVDR